MCVCVYLCMDGVVHTFVSMSVQTSGVAQVCVGLWVCVQGRACTYMYVHRGVQSVGAAQGHCGTGVCVHFGSERKGLHMCECVCAQGCTKGCGCVSVCEHIDSAWMRWHKCVLAQGCAEELGCTQVHTKGCLNPLPLRTVFQCLSSKNSLNSLQLTLLKLRVLTLLFARPAFLEMRNSRRAWSLQP